MLTLKHLHLEITDLTRKVNFLLYTNSQGGGGTTIYTGDGSLAGSREVTLGGNTLAWTGTAGSSITSTADSHTFNGSFINAPLTDGTAVATITAIAHTGDDVYFQMRAQETGQNAVSIVGNGATSSITSTADHHIYVGVQEFADNAAAITGGLATGTIYRTGDLLKIVH